MSGAGLAATVVAAAGEQQLPEDVGKSGPLGLLLTLVLLVAVILLVRSMSTHLKRVPRSFDPADAPPEIPDTPEELVRRPEPGHEILDDLRRAPRAIEGPRNGDGRPDASKG